MNRGLAFFIGFLFATTSAVTTAASSTSASNTYSAVVAVVNKYERVLEGVNLGNATDAMVRALRAHAKRLGYPDSAVRIQVLTEGTSTQTPSAFNILSAVQEASRAAFSPNDTVVFFFSGHGVRSDDDVVLIASGASTHEDDRYHVRLRQILSRVRNSEAGRRVIFIDACQTFNLAGKLSAPPTLLGDGTLDNIKSQGIAIYFSSSEGEYSEVDKHAGMGFFTKHLARALSNPAIGKSEPGIGAPIQYGDQLALYLARVVSREVEKNNGKQRPRWRYEHGSGPFYLELVGQGIQGPMAAIPKEAAKPDGGPKQKVRESRPECEVGFIDHTKTPPVYTIQNRC